MTVAVETGLWQLDPAASSVQLRHKAAWGMVSVKGVFTSVRGQGEVRPDGSATGTVTLDATSLDTKNPKRDAHLRQADFFDADNHPEIVFTVGSAKRLDGGAVRVDGRLTVRGVTRPLSLTGRLAEVGADSLVLEAEFTVDRTDFGITWNQLGMLAKPSTLITRLRFTRAAA
ncbi:YceI family protein [Streptomyces sp. NPDC048514]|uniref:YceI family protein n=1 Tax=Streptomyces sp. NPDC048514 TaxID=3365564 RepID=UPI003718F07B